MFGPEWDNDFRKRRDDFDRRWDAHQRMFPVFVVLVILLGVLGICFKLYVATHGGVNVVVW